MHCVSLHVEETQKGRRSLDQSWRQDINTVIYFCTFKRKQDLLVWTRAPLGSAGGRWCMKWLLCLWVNSNRRKEQREREREVGRTERVVWRCMNKKWGLYFQPLHSGHISPYGAFFTRHALCCLCSTASAYQVLLDDASLILDSWFSDYVPLFCPVCAEQTFPRYWLLMSHVVKRTAEPLLSIEVNLCSTLKWKNNDRHLSRGVLSVTGSADVGSLTLLPHS